MKTVVIENPILNSPYREPTRHFRLDANDEITNIIDAGRRGNGVPGGEGSGEPCLILPGLGELNAATGGPTADGARLIRLLASAGKRSDGWASLADRLLACGVLRDHGNREVQLG